MRDVIGKGAAVVRRRKRWTQEQAARAYRACGLTTWRTGTVGQLEVGARNPGLGDLFRMCRALGVTLPGLIRAADPDGTCMVELAPGVFMSTQAIRDRLKPGTSPGQPVTLPKALRSVPSDSERHAARRLGTTPAEIREASAALWSRSFDEERDARAGNVTGMEPRSRQARRGLAAREMLAEIGKFLDT